MTFKFLPQQFIPHRDANEKPACQSPKRKRKCKAIGSSQQLKNVPYSQLPYAYQIKLKKATVISFMGSIEDELMDSTHSLDCTVIESPAQTKYLNRCWFDVGTYITIVKLSSRYNYSFHSAHQ